MSFKIGQEVMQTPLRKRPYPRLEAHLFRIILAERSQLADQFSSNESATKKVDFASPFTPLFQI